MSEQFNLVKQNFLDECRECRFQLGIKVQTCESCTKLHKASHTQVGFLDVPALKTLYGKACDVPNATDGKYYTLKNKFEQNRADYWGFQPFDPILEPSLKTHTNLTHLLRPVQAIPALPIMQPMFHSGKIPVVHTSQVTLPIWTEY